MYLNCPSLQYEIVFKKSMHKCSFTTDKLQDKKNKLEDNLFKQISANDPNKVQSVMARVQSHAFEAA